MLEIDRDTALRLRPFAKPYRRDGEILARSVDETRWELEHAGAVWRLGKRQFDSAYLPGSTTTQSGRKVVSEAGWTTALPLTEAFRLQGSDGPAGGGIVYELDGTCRVCLPDELAAMTPITGQGRHVFVSYAHDDPSEGLLFDALGKVAVLLEDNHDGLGISSDRDLPGETGKFPSLLADKIATATAFLVVVSDTWMGNLKGWARRHEYPYILLQQVYLQAPVVVVSIGCDLKSHKENPFRTTRVFGPSAELDDICRSHAVRIDEDGVSQPVEVVSVAAAKKVFHALSARLTSFDFPAQNGELAILDSVQRVTVPPVGHTGIDTPPKLRTSPYGADPSVVLQSRKGTSSATAYAPSTGSSQAFASDDGRLLAFSTAGTLSCIGVADVEAAAALPMPSRGVSVVWRPDADAAADPVLAVNRLVRVLAVACRSGVFLVDSTGEITGRFPLADSKDAALIRSSLVTIDDNGALHARDLVPGISTGLLDAVGLLEQVGDGDWQAVDAAIGRASDGVSERVVVAALRGSPVVDELVVVSFGLAGTPTVIRHGRLDRPADSVAIGRGLDHLDRVLVLSAATGARQINESGIPEWSPTKRDGLGR